MIKADFSMPLTPSKNIGLLMQGMNYQLDIKKGLLLRSGNRTVVNTRFYLRFFGHYFLLRVFSLFRVLACSLHLIL